LIVAFDANVLVYAVDNRNVDKRDRALAAISAALRSDVAALPLQALGEFVRGAQRVGIAHAQIAERVDAWGVAFTLLPVAPPDLPDGLALVARHRLQFWDSVMIATCARHGVRWLVTEDMADGATMRGVTLLDPFQPHNVPLMQEIGLA
jgi:predicted nucleic acid-binding protein